MVGIVGLVLCVACHMFSKLCYVHCIVFFYIHYSVLCALCSVQCALCSMQCVLSTVQYVLCSLQHVMCSVQYDLCSVQFVLCSVKGYRGHPCKDQSGVTAS